MNGKTRGRGSKDWIGGDVAVDLSFNGSTLAFECTRMGADHTLMSIRRKTLPLIGFGFMIRVPPA